MGRVLDCVPEAAGGKTGMSLDTPNLTTTELRARVMKQWSPPAFSVLTEVRNGTGYGRQEGYADALVMSLWPSRGLEMIGCEFKVSRSDWLRELKDPAKAEKFFNHCHRWYLVTANGAARADEVPAPWGWMVAGPAGLKTMKEAPTLTPVVPDWSLIASIFRNVGAGVQGMVSQAEVDKLVSERVEKEWESHKATVDHLQKAIDDARGEKNRLWSAVQAFESASGVCFDKWTADEAKFREEGERYHLFREGGVETFKKQLRDMESRLDGMKAAVERALA